MSDPKELGKILDELSLCRNFFNKSIDSIVEFFLKTSKLARNCNLFNRI